MERIEEGTFRFAEAFPGASQKDKAYFTQLEGRVYQPEPQQVLLGEYVKEWMKSIFPSFGSPTKRNDYREAIETKILPHFKNVSFYQITSTTVFKFTETLLCTRGENKGNYINVKSSYVLGEDKKSLKTAFRKLQVFITRAIRERLETILNRSASPYVFTMEDGARFSSSRFCKVWKKSVDASGITSVTSYSARHSFAAWSLLVGINPLRLVKLMGHASKQMVYEVYGNYVDGLEEDGERIFEYMGRDFIIPQKSKSPVPYGYSTGESYQRFQLAT